MTEDKDDCNIIKGILETEIACETQETDLVNDTIPIVKIINNNGKYDFNFIQNIDSQIFISYIPFTTSRFIDLFKSPDIKTSGFYYDDYKANYRKFLQLQSLFTKFLIKKKVKLMTINNFLLIWE